MNSLIQNSAYTFLSQILSVVSSFGALIIISRILGPEQQGQYSLMSMLPRIALYVFSFGAPISFIYFWNTKKDVRWRLLQRYRVYYLMLSLLAFISAAIFVFTSKHVFYENIANIQLIKVLILIFCLFYNSLQGAKLQAQERFKLLSIITFSQPFSFFICLTIFALARDLSFNIVVNSFCFSHILAAIIFTTLMITNPIYVNQGQDKKLEKTFFLKSLKFSILTHISSLAIFLTYRMDMFFISKFLTDRDIGIYMISVNIAERTWMISESVAKVLFARLVKIHGMLRQTNLTLKVNRMSALMNLFAVLTLAIFGKIFIAIFFGDQYADSYQYLLVLLPGVYFSASAKLLSRDIEASGHPRICSNISVISLIFNFFTNLILIPNLDIFGAALATTLTYVFYAVLTTIAFCRLKEVSMLQFITFKKSDFTQLIRIFSPDSLKSK